jgi:hypothetical protein
MEAGGRTPDGQPRRPLLAGGEHLSSEVERGGGGGEKSHPRSLEQALEILSPQFDAVQQGVAAIPTSMRGARVVFEAKVLPNYVSNSDFPRELFAEADLFPVGTKVATGTYRTPKTEPEERETKNYLLAGDERSFTRLGNFIRGELGEGGRAAKARLRLRQFDLLRLPRASEVLRGTMPRTGETITWEAVFHPSLDGRGALSSSEQNAVWEKWITLVEGLGGEVAGRYRRRVKDLLFVPVRLPVAAVTEAAAFNPLRTLRPMPSVRPVPVSPLRVLDRQGPDPPPGERPQSELRVAVFDGGVDEGASQLSPFLQSTDLTDEDPDPEDVAHGTLVSAAVLFGADHGEAELRTPEVGVDHFRVLPPPESETWDLDLYWILDRIENQLDGGRHRIVNLSIGPEQCLEEDDEPTPGPRSSTSSPSVTESSSLTLLATMGKPTQPPAPTGSKPPRTWSTGSALAAAMPDLQPRPGRARPTALSAQAALAHGCSPAGLPSGGFASSHFVGSVPAVPSRRPMGRALLPQLSPTASPRWPLSSANRAMTQACCAPSPPISLNPPTPMISMLRLVSGG